MSKDNVTISPDQNTVEYKAKTFTFEVSPSETITADDCDHCEFNRTDVCTVAPCYDREDEKSGYFIRKK